MWFDPKPVSWVGASTYQTYGMSYTAAKHLRITSSGPIKPLAQFVETRMRRKVSGVVTRRVAAKAVMSSTMAISLTGRVAVRALPVVGWALLAYDVYTVGDALYDWYKDDS